MKTPRIGIALFTAASLLCGLAWSGEALIAFRDAQGGGVAMMARAMATVRSCWYVRRKAPSANCRCAGIGRHGRSRRNCRRRLLGGPITCSPGLGVASSSSNVPIGLALLAPGCGPASREPNRSLPRAYARRAAATVTLALVRPGEGVTEVPRVDPPGQALERGRLRRLGCAAGRLPRDRAPLERTPGAVTHLPLPSARERYIAPLVAGMSVDGVLFILTLYAQRVLGVSG